MHRISVRLQCPREMCVSSFECFTALCVFSNMPPGAVVMKPVFPALPVVALLAALAGAMAMRKAPCSPADSRLAVSSPWSLHYFQSVNGFCHCQMTWRVAITDWERVCCMQFIASRALGVGRVVVILEELREVKINGGVKNIRMYYFCKVPFKF